MKRAILTFMLFAFSLTNAQEREISEADLYEKAEASEVEYNRNFDKAESAAIKVKTYTYYSALVANYSKSEHYSIYLYNKGFWADNKAEQKQCFKKVIEANNPNWLYYTRQSYIELCSLAIDEKDFSLAKQYLNAVDKMQRPIHTCGNAVEADHNRVNNLRKRVNDGIKN
jgi:hypothetical protein